MKHRIWGSSPILIISTVLGLGLFLLLFVYSQGAVVSAAVPGSAGDGPSYGNRGQAVAVEKFIEPEELVISTLAANTTDSWSFYLGAREAWEVYLPVILNNYFTGKGFLEPEQPVNSILATHTSARTITLTVAPGTMVDLVLSVIDEDGTVVVDNQNLSPAGEVETIANLSIAGEKTYEVLISTVQGEGTDYALMLLDQDSYNFVFRGTFFDTGSQNDSLPEETDHFWFFNALGGNSVSFTIAPVGDGDAYVELFGPDGQRMLTLDENGAGEPESLENYTVLDSGLYGIRVGEFDFLPMDYQISVSK
jgi:hypothetical protein